MVDDSPELLEVARTLFDSKEFIFVSAKDGAEGLFKAKNQKFDVVICDIKMPKMDGATFVKEYRRLVKGEGPVLLYSGHLDALPPELKEFKNIYRLAKHCQSYELLERVRSLATGHAMPSTLAKSTQMRFEAGSLIFCEGERGADCYVIDEGSIEVLKEFSDGSELLLDVLEAGEFLGTWAPPDGQYRFYTARAKTLVTMTLVTQAMIGKELEHQPVWLQSMIKSQFHRLNNAYQRLKKNHSDH